MDQTGDKSVPALHGIFACRVCCATTGKLFWLEFRGLKQEFFNLTGIQVYPRDGLPQYICYVCCGLLQKAAAFRKKCHSMQSLLLVHSQTQIQTDILKRIHLLHGQLLKQTKTLQISAGVEFENNSNLTDKELQNDLNDKDLENNLNSNYSDNESNPANYFGECKENKNDLTPETDPLQQADIKNEEANNKDDVNPCDGKMILDTDIAGKEVKQYILNDISTNPHTKNLYKHIEDRCNNRMKTLQVSVGEKSESDLIPIDKQLQRDWNHKELENNLSSNCSDNESTAANYFDECEDNENDLTPEIDPLEQADIKNKEANKKDDTNPCDGKMICDTDTAGKKVKHVLNDLSTNPYTRNLYKHTEVRCYKRTKTLQVSVGEESESNLILIDKQLQHDRNHKDLENNLNSSHSDDELIAENYFYYYEENKNGLTPETDPLQQADLKNKEANNKDNINPCDEKMICDTDIGDKKVKQCILNDLSTNLCTKNIYKHIEDRCNKRTKTLQVSVGEESKSYLIPIDNQLQSNRNAKDLENNLNSINYSDDDLTSENDFDDSEENEDNLKLETDQHQQADFKIKETDNKDNTSPCEVKKIHDTDEFHDYLKNKYGYISDKGVKKKIETDIHKECRKVTTSLSDGDKTEMEFKDKYNFDIEIFSKEEQIKNMLEKKESDRYKNAIYKCEGCYTGFNYEDIYIKHRIDHDPALSGNVECGVCKMKFQTRRRLGHHIYMTHKFRCTCRTCGLVYSNRSHCKDHYLSHSGGAIYQCRHCPENFKRIGALVSHIRYQHGSVYCDICQTILTVRGLTRHMRTQHKKTFKCQSCEKKFNDSDALEKHVQTSPNSVCNPNYWACSKCGDNFSSESLYSEHIESYHRRGPGVVKNNLPNKSKRQKPTGKSKKKKWGEPAMCEVCARIFPNTSRLKLHMRVHTGEKPYQCNVCPMSFSVAGGLQNHMRKHTGETPFVCSVCSKSFASLSNLQRHQSVHSKLRPYACHICHKTYPVAGTVKTHIRTVHMKIRGPPRIRRRKRRTDENKREKVVAENKEVELDENKILDDDEGNIEEKAKDNEEEMPIVDSDNESEADCEEETVEDKREDSDIEGQTYVEQEIIDDCEVEERQVGLDRNEETGNEGEAVCFLEDWDEYREEIIVDQYDDDNDSEVDVNSK